ncbi:type II toxin-antitoxin system VapC family toxin [Thermococcus sp.]|uniref:type II toxin-antitoxin system VapC family toxin n=1 Tax=Thermococcus sp. TaxID=35749 RepID=UPI0025D10232|nr:type II toxin-antitoxin system VapC family toxin [Thermococcus sp.]
MLVVDTSAFIDSIIPVKGKEDRNRLARRAISAAEASGIPVLMPRLGVVETISLVKRLTGKEEAVDLTVEYLEAKVLQVSEDWIFEDAKTIARKIHPRAADSYFIATAKKFNAILISSDKDMVAHAKKMGIKAFYILDEKQLNEYLDEISGGAV